MPQFKKNVWVIALGLALSSITHAQSQNLDAEVDQLRAEVTELKNLLKQYTDVQHRQAVQLQQIEPQKKDSISDAPATNVQKTDFGLTVAGAEVKLYGNVRLDAQYQSEGGAATRSYNQINSVPLEGMAERSDEFKSTLSATRLGLDFKSAVNDQDVSGKVEVDFLGGANFDNLRIRHAYVNWGKWLIGQTWSNFAVPDYMPESIDALGFVGGAVKRTPQLRYHHSLSADTKLITALEDPKDNSIHMRMPAFTTRINHKASDQLQVSGRAMAHEKRLDGQEEWAWGIGVGAKYDVLPNTSIKADYYQVKGDSSFVSWTNAGVVKTPSGSLIQNEFDSITLGVTQKFNDKLHGTLGYGLMKFDRDQDYISALVNPTSSNKELWQAWANVFYSPVKPISLGVEYVYGEREAFAPAVNGSQTGEDNRINAVAIYNF